MTHLDCEREPIDLLAEEFADRCRNGERPSVGDYAARHPELADQIRELLPPVAAIEQLKRLKQTATVAAPEGNPPARLGDFRIVREVGRGGMGIVYEAAQESLGRVVALKVLPKHALLDQKKRERFQREAQAAARLHHTNIVPVFGVGEEDGLPYYVMQLIDGKGLHEVVAEWQGEVALARAGNTTVAATTPADEKPVPPILTVEPQKHPALKAISDIAKGQRLPRRWAEIAGMGVQAAQALDYAHKQGTLHRDVKPANLLLDKHGTVWVTDFGLAKLAGHQEITNTGDVIGTLSYMAPECFQGLADARSDVYSLGLTLYELLTLQPPFSERDPAKLIKQVSEQEPPRPRRLNPALPRDLETVILKAIAREPGHRYQTAGELADDLQRFLDDRPIQARRVTPLERLARSCRRNPVIASLTAAAVAFLLLAIGLGVKGYHETREALENVKLKRTEAEAINGRLRIKSAEAKAAAKRAEINSAEAKAAAKRAEIKTAEAKAATENAEANQQLLLDGFEDIFDNLSARDERPASKNVLATLVSGSNAPSGSAADAALLKSLLEFYDRFAERNDTNPRLRQEAAKAHGRVGEIHQRTGQNEKAESAFKRSSDMLEKLAEEYPNVPVYPVALARSRARRGTVLLRLKRTKDGETLLRQAIAVPKTLVDRVPDPALAQAELSLARFTLADVLYKRGQKKEAETFRAQAVATLKNLQMAIPQSSRRPFSLAGHLREAESHVKKFAKSDDFKKFSQKTSDWFKKMGMPHEKKERSGSGKGKGRKSPFGFGRGSRK